MSKPIIPAWQRTASTDPPSLSADEPKPENAAEDSTKPVAEEPARSDAPANDAKSTDLPDQARRFLEDPNIRNAPREKKAVFLQAKGVSSEDIETLLGKAIQPDASPDLEAAGARAWSTVRLLDCRQYLRCKLTALDTSSARPSNTCAATTTTRTTAYRHISRVPHPGRKATAADNHQSPGAHSICCWRSDGVNIRIVQVHHCTNG